MHNDEWRISSATLAVEFWKLLRAFDRAITLAPDNAKKGLSAQARYSRERLSALANMLEIRLVSFDGLKFEVNLPVVAVDAEDFVGATDVVIEQTLEPAVVSNGNVLVTGRVFVAAKNNQEEKT